MMSMNIPPGDYGGGCGQSCTTSKLERPMKYVPRVGYDASCDYGMEI